MYIWEGRWSLPEGFESKKEFKMYLAKKDYILITDVHFSKKNSYHSDVLQYDKSGKVRRKMHLKVSDGVGTSLANCIRKL